MRRCCSYPPLHLWLLLASPEVRPARLGSAALVAGGLLPLGLLLAFYAHQLGFGPVGLAWASFLLLAGGGVGVFGVLLWCVALGCAAAAVMLVLASRTRGGGSHCRPNCRRSRFAAPSATPARGRSAGPSRRSGDEVRTTEAPLTEPSPPRELLPAPRGGRARRRALRVLAWVLIFAGTLALLDAAVTLVWQEPISALYAKLEQDHLEGALRHVERAPPTAAERRELASLSDERRRIAFLAGELDRRTADGGAIGRIVIPRIGVSFVVVKGTSTEDLETGPGIYPETGFPGSGRTTAIAGHRTTFLAPFRHIDALRYGNRIRLQMPYAEFVYMVIGERVVAPTDVQAAVGTVSYNRLVLSACTPLFSAAKRLLVFAHLVRTVPRGAARILPGGANRAPDRSEHGRAAPRRRAGSGEGHLPPVLEPLDPRLLSPLV